LVHESETSFYLVDMDSVEDALEKLARGLVDWVFIHHPDCLPDSDLCDCEPKLAGSPFRVLA